MKPLTSTGPNAEQITYWNEGAAPKWIAYQRILDAQLRPLGRAVMDRLGVRAGERVLDVGCGCGDTTLELAERVGSTGSVAGVDVSAPMLERADARAREAGIANVRFENADAQTHAFQPASFDLAFSRFGVMFFADPTSAFANVHGALAEGGRLGFVCWQPLERNPWMGLPMAAAARVITFPPRPPADAPGPFSFADPDRVRGILARAGFAAITLEGLDTALTVGDDDLQRSVEFLVQMGPTGTALRDAGPDAFARVTAAVKDAVAPFHTAEGLRMDAAAWIVSARR